MKQANKLDSLLHCHNGLIGLFPLKLKYLGNQKWKIQDLTTGGDHRVMEDLYISNA